MSETRLTAPVQVTGQDSIDLKDFRYSPLEEATKDLMNNLFVQSVIGQGSSDFTIDVYETKDASICLGGRQVSHLALLDTDDESSKNEFQEICARIVFIVRQSSVPALRKDLAAKEGELESALEENRALSKELNSMRLQLSTKNGDLDSLQNRYATLARRFELAEMKIAELQSEIETLKSIPTTPVFDEAVFLEGSDESEEVSRLQVELNETNSRYDELYTSSEDRDREQQAAIRALRSQVRELEAKLEDQEEVVTVPARTVVSVAPTVSMEDYNFSIEQSERLEGQLEKAQGKASAAESRNAKLKAQLADVQGQLAALEETKERWDKRAEAAERNNKSAAKKAKEQMQQLRDEIDGLKAHGESRESYLTTLIKEQQRLQKLYNELLENVPSVATINGSVR